MNQSQTFSLFALRVSLGWMFFWAGITKVLDPTWTAVGYLQGAKVGMGFYQWLASPGVLPMVNLVNEWGLTLLGISLVLGIGMRVSTKLGVLLMLLYWLPLGIVHPDAHSLVVDEHIIYSAALLVLAAFRAGRVWGLGSRLPEVLQ